MNQRWGDMGDRLPRFACLVVIGMLTLLAGCATTGGNNHNPRDPLERYNRAIFSFNDSLDTYVTKPIAEAYRFVLPSMVRSGVRNFFSNIEDVWIGVNNLLQGKVEDGLSDFMRVGINSTIGLAGLLDVASETRLEKHNEDFGQTLGKWGVGSGPYFVLPFLGPSTIRDSAAYPVDFQANLIGSVANAVTTTKEVALRTGMWGANFTGRRADLLDASSLVDQAALDRYSFIRDAFLQRRRSLVYDGNPPKEPILEEDEPEPNTSPAVPPVKPPGTSGRIDCLFSLSEHDVDDPCSGPVGSSPSGPRALMLAEAQGGDGYADPVADSPRIALEATAGGGDVTDERPQIGEERR